jgi:mannose PTS system EIIA component
MPTPFIETCGRILSDEPQLVGMFPIERFPAQRRAEAYRTFAGENPMSTDGQQTAKQSADARKVAGVIVTHGNLAGELLAAAEMIIGPISHIAAVSIGWHDDVDTARAEVERAIARVSQRAGVLLMTDMFGGTPTNIASMFLEAGAIEVVTGVNLPMVIRLATQPEQGTLADIARNICDLGRQAIYQASDLLMPIGKSGKNA